MSAAVPTQSDARFATSAALAETEASTIPLSKEVEKNATKLHEAAHDASAQAQFQPTGGALDKLEHDLSKKTNVAAAEGKSDVEAAKATSAGYVEQVVNIATNAVNTAQSYIAGTGTNTHAPPTGLKAAPHHETTSTGGVPTTVQSAVATGKAYVEAGIAAAQPYVEAGLHAAQPHLDKARNIVTGGPTGTATTKPSEVPATTAALESGPHVVDKPYPEGQAPVKVNEVV